MMANRQIAYMFPGQGSQFIGMGKALFEQFPEETRACSTLLNHDIIELCVYDKASLLNKTQYTQPAIFFVSALTSMTTKQLPYFCIGHSLGLYGALFAAGVISLPQGLSIVKKRAELMAKVQDGGMMAIIGGSPYEVEERLLSSGYADIDVANYNSDKQVVISGKTERLKSIPEELAIPSWRFVMLPVSGAFHSRHMQSVANQFLHYLQNQPFGDFKCPVYSTTSGEKIQTNHLIEELALQLTQPVRWQQCIKFLKKTYSDIELIEMAPGQVLTNLNRDIK